MQPDFSRPVLAIDTATAHLSLALRAGGGLFARHTEAGSRQSALILPQIAELFAEAGVSAADLAAVVYAQGPGAFTGLRIGLGVAQGLAAPFATPLIGVPCLDAAAFLVRGRGVLAAADARMGEVFYAWFDTENRRRLSPYCVGKAAAIAPPEGVEFTHGSGNAFALNEPPPFPGSPVMPTAADYLALAQTGGYPACDAADASLLYVRDKIALTAAEQAAHKAGAA
ncbi:tRNA (adenosine(37)-N6)-threonylcarbamoyltransferase complex dimerization subunit type 1 TsaB [Neisseria bacilliformis]|uniref:tRNA (adenosine(37)-N6)-threonylcarbamoyltransferase complex dimerization subunit type 1 TsaB n=1 Tax=Neisseria bacilliformis TaxID=267212 RepID=UPI0006687075|nr:tRNA (adenosine(37)-N6)-threonylcarbamoyltransferase complex dimerization subunit type 1 TsaB [Neisseria bacilliformis]